jgi:hypothetical protein
LGQLATEDFDSGWGNNAERDSIALDFDDFHSDVAIDNQLITNFPTENEHFASSLSVIAAAGAGIVGLSQPNTIIIRLALDNLGQRRIEFKIIDCLRPPVAAVIHQIPERHLSENRSIRKPNRRGFAFQAHQ